MTLIVSILLSVCLNLWLQPDVWGGAAIGILSYMACSVWRALVVAQ